MENATALFEDLTMRAPSIFIQDFLANYIGNMQSGNRKFVYAANTIDLIMKKIGICAHSYEGGLLCLITACREGAALLEPHMHPNIILSVVPMGLSMSAWEYDNYDEVARHLHDGVQAQDNEERK